MIKKSSKTQITIFVIIALIIITSFAAIMIFTKNNSQSQISLTKTDGIKGEIEKCLNQNLNDLVNYVAIQGGYFGLSEYSIDYGLDESSINYPISIPYYLYNSERIYPSIQRIEQEIAFGLNATLLDCVNLSDSRLKISPGAKIALPEILIEENKITAKINLPIRVTEKDSNYLLNNFYINLPSNFSKAYLIALKISEEQFLKGDSICLTCTSRIMEESQFLLETNQATRLNEFIIIYSLQDPANENFVFNFAHKYPIK
jgi:hypothetical protein